MKRFFALLFALFRVGLYAQVIGGFQYYNDGHIYFQAQNQSGYVFNVTVYAVSSDRRNSEVATLGPGGGFYIGPTTPWRWFWKEGDRLTIVYPNGQSVYWVCPQTDPAYRRNQTSFRSNQTRTINLYYHVAGGNWEKIATAEISADGSTVYYRNDSYPVKTGYDYYGKTVYVNMSHGSRWYLW